MDHSLRTLVVGGGGFIGSQLTQFLRKTGKRRITVTGRRSQPAHPLPPDITYIQADMADVSVMQSLLANTDEIIDLAYGTVPKTSYDDPVHDVLSNLPATVSLLKMASNYPLRCFMLVSSGGTVYGNPLALPVDEAHPTNPVSPYGITKLTAEKYGLLFKHQTGLPVVIVRPSNPYGPGQYGNRIQGFIGAAIYTVINREKITIYGETGTIRDYIYIDDLAAGLIAALEYGQAGDIYNIGTGIGHDNVSVLEMLDEIVRPSGYAVQRLHEAARTFDVTANILNPARLSNLSGWRPRVDLASGLERIWNQVQRQSFRV
jgi:UDP-glucose 4-epimerase